MHTIVGVLEQKCIPNRVDELVSNPLTWAAIKTTIKNDPELTAADKEFFRLFSRVGHMREVRITEMTRWLTVTDELTVGRY